MTRRKLFLGVALAWLAAAAPAGAEPKLSASGPVVRVADVDPSAAPELAEIELCKAPPPGSSRLLSRRDMQTRVREAGADPKGLILPSSLRVETPAERWNPADVAGRADAAVRAALPHGVTLVKLTALRGVVVPPGTTVTNVKHSLPRRAGRHTLTAIAELSAADEVVTRAQLSVVVNVSEAALEPLVKKGDRVTLLVRHGNASVGASANALADANAGDSVWFKVATTGKVLKAKLTSRDVGMVVDP